MSRPVARRAAAGRRAEIRGPWLCASFLGPLLCWSTAAPAAPDTCLDLSNQPAMNLCEARQYAAADKALNAAYEALTARVGAANRPALKDAEAKWVAFRDAQCAFDTLGSEGGSIHPTVVFQCLTDLTEQQARRLDAQLHCEEGDMGCGGQ